MRFIALPPATLALSEVLTSGAARTYTSMDANFDPPSRSEDQHSQNKNKPISRGAMNESLDLAMEGTGQLTEASRGVVSFL